MATAAAGVPATAGHSSVEAQANAAMTSPVFPKEFMKGVGMSVWQNSCDGGTKPGTEHCKAPSNWGQYAQRKKFFGQADFSDAWCKSNDFWNLYESHIKLARDSLSTNSFRFSFEWHRLQPNGPDGPFDQDAVDRYHKIIDCIIANGMEPCATFHHFTHPMWFEDAGGFETEANNPAFVEYCKVVFGHYQSKIKLWATFNEPTCVGFVGYIAGLWCPGKLCHFTEAGEVLLVLLKAHVAAWKAIKAMPGGKTACIGLVNQHIRFMPKSQWAPHIKLLCKWMTRWFASDCILKFFSTGVYEWVAPFRGITVKANIPEAVGTLDWWGINYYSYPCVSSWFVLGASDAKEPVSDIGFRIYPQGLYDSVRDATCLRVPIYITETGLADHAGKHRQYLIEGHTDALLRCVADGFDVRGMYYWTLMDNIEWHEGFHVKYGLFEWDPKKAGDALQNMKLRPGSAALKQRYESWPETVKGVQDMVAGASHVSDTDIRIEVDNDTPDSRAPLNASNKM
ncbi:hypothetical protein FOA52_007797 [Chlamydomonas sp. UWO 241]|nr:hypothetical protein FOA52_007797 [Chlamydomonas sp. UWO 241]